MKKIIIRTHKAAKSLIIKIILILSLFKTSLQELFHLWWENEWIKNKFINFNYLNNRTNNKMKINSIKISKMKIIMQSLKNNSNNKKISEAFLRLQHWINFYKLIVQLNLRAFLLMIQLLKQAVGNQITPLFHLAYLEIQTITIIIIIKL